jgi:WXXGXW repeat (2 copies)
MHTNTMIRTFAFSLLFAMFCLMMPAPSAAQIGVGVAVSIAPPELPVYDQPICPGDGYIWTPGYWAWDPDVADYYWVPGTWVLGPEPGFLWTPGYWGWGNGGFFWTAGYWGPVVGF